MRRPAAVVVALLLAVGCGVRPERAPTTDADASVPFSLLQGTTTTSQVAPAGGNVEIQVCFHEGDRLVAVIRRARTSSVEGAIDAYAAGPTAEERARGVASALFEPSLPRRVTVAGGVATVGLSTAFTQAGTSTQLEIVAEVVCTVTARPGIGQVRFQVGDEPIDVPRGDGSLAADPVSRDDYRDVMP